jgi:uncharacterized protein (UPF0276 family)
LLAANRVHVDYLKVGPWIGLERMEHCHDALITPQLNVRALATLVEKTSSPWLSLHLGLPETGLNLLWQRFGIPFARIQYQAALQQAVTNIHLLTRTLPVPIAIENQAQHRHSGHDYLVDPAFISAALDSTEGHLLLDLGHARVSAAMRGESAEGYINHLPLERVIEVHVSSPGLRRGRLRDLHYPLTLVDYELLRFVLARCPFVRAITLEYYGPANLLSEQLQKLHGLLQSL